MTLILLNALLPIFVGLLLGYIAGRRGFMDNLNVRNLIVLVMDFAIPCALFSTISSTSWPVLREQSEFTMMIAVVFVALYAASQLSAACFVLRRNIFYGRLDARIHEVLVRESNGWHAACPRSPSP